MGAGERRRRRACPPYGVGERSGQMAVELAALIPVVVVVALVVVNLMRFVGLCARFDRAAPDAVLTQGVSPAGELDLLAATDRVRSALEGSMASEACDVEVSAQPMDAAAGDAVLWLAAGTTRYTCTLVFHPWPSTISLAGVRAYAPLSLRHERSIVVDRFRAGVVA